MSSIYTPESVINEINKIPFPFVWSKKKEWLSRSSVIQHPSGGGLRIVDVKSKIDSLLVLWMKPFLTNTSGQ